MPCIHDANLHDFRQDGQQMCMNVYDVRKYDTLPACGMNWPEDLSEATNYLDVRLNYISLLSHQMN